MRERGVDDRCPGTDDMSRFGASRIVSLACSNTEILFTLGLGDRVVGVDDWSDFPPQVERLPKVGPDLKINIARVGALDPDLILASLSVPGMERNIPAIERLGVPFLVLNPKSLEEVLTDIEMVGEATGVPENARRLIAGLRTRIAAVRARAQGAAHRPTVYWEWWPKPLISPGRQSWIVQMSELAAADLLFKDVEASSVVVHESQILDRDPDHVVLCWCGTLQKKMDVAKVAARPGWERLRAVKAGRIHCLPEELFGRPGPRLVEGLEALARVVHPEVFVEAAIVS
ncbi:MAG TPA: cobalamin-binding protein [Candidatus Methylomirabilis sp.]|nr:cobalamin-binding protein [Candidatus Methylomirabilis sp.]